MPRVQKDAPAQQRHCLVPSPPALNRATQKLSCALDQTKPTRVHSWRNRARVAETCAELFPQARRKEKKPILRRARIGCRSCSCLSPFGSSRLPHSRTSVTAFEVV